MTNPSIRALSLGVMLAGVSAVAHAGPVSVLYLTTSGNLAAVQGTNVLYNQSQETYFEWAIAVNDTVRTASYWARNAADPYPDPIAGREYDLSLGASIGNTVAPDITFLADGATDGVYNYSVVERTVYRFGLDWSGGESLFTIDGTVGAADSNWIGITYDPFTASLWLMEWQNGTQGTTVAQFGLDGTLGTSFSTGMTQTAGLAMDYADGTLWLSDEQRWYQFGTDGMSLGLQAYPDARGVPLYGNAIRGAEFAFQSVTAVPVPAAAWLFGSGLLGLIGVARRKTA